MAIEDFGRAVSARRRPYRAGGARAPVSFAGGRAAGGSWARAPGIVVLPESHGGGESLLARVAAPGALVGPGGDAGEDEAVPGGRRRAM